ncbi:TasA family protein [Halorussus sp. AFM4]|uniref:TasA family protein n=1 Tax=Halorussus sp. AFM4 TaxID=3421651 RepID=UPI003EB7A4E1
MNVRRILANASRREVLLSLLVVGVASSALGAVTWAHFSDSDASRSNALEAGTLDVTLDGANGQTASFSLTNARPADSTRHNFTLRNVGSTAGNHVEVTLSFSENDTRTEPSDPDLGTELDANATASHVRVTQLVYKDDSGTVIENPLSNVSDDNNNGIKDLDDVRNQAGTLDNLRAPKPNGASETYLVIGVRIANDDDAFTGTDEDIMADGVDVKITVTLNQDSSQ